MLRDMGRAPVSQDLLKSYIGNGIHWLVKRALTGDMYAEPDAALFDKALPIYEKHYTELACTSKPFQNVVKGLDAMKAAGFRLGCITNKVERYTTPILKSADLAKYFEIVVAGDTLPEKKPHPMPLLHSAKFFRRADRKFVAGWRLTQRCTGSTRCRLPYHLRALWLQPW